MSSRPPRNDRVLPYVVVGGSVLLALTIAAVGTLALVSLGRDTPPEDLTGQETVLITGPTEVPISDSPPVTIPLAQFTPGPATPTPDSIAAMPTPRPASATSPNAASPSGPASSSRPPPSGGVETYVVMAGDTLGTIAARFEVSMDTLLLVNDLSDSELIREGQTLHIPIVDGLVHEVQAGETVAGIARQYDVTVEAIGQHNDLDSAYTIRVGQMLVIPGVRATPPPPAPTPEPTAPPAPTSPSATPEPTPVPTAVVVATPVPTPQPAPDPTPMPAAGPGTFEWPALGSVIRSPSPDHPGLALSGGHGAPAMASAPGTVVSAAQLDTGYGWHVVLDHGNGFSTLYGNLSAIQVQIGDSVSRLQVIGAIGQTGNAPETQLYFELRHHGLAVDPRPYLP